MRYQTSSTTRNGFDVVKTQASQVSKAIDKLARRSFHYPTRSLNRVSEYSLPNSQIKDISRRAFSAISRQKQKPMFDVINVIKGKPHCMKFGQREKASIGFGQLYNEFYTNIYSDRVPSLVKISLDQNTINTKPMKSSKQIQNIRMIAKLKKKRTNNFTYEPRQKQSSYLKTAQSIILQCNSLLEVNQKRLFKRKQLV